MVIFVVMITAHGSGTKKILLRGAMAVLLFGAIIGGAIFVGGDTSLTRVVDTAASKDVTTGRFEIWGVTMKMIGSNLPFGSGLGAYGVAYTQFDKGSGLERVEQAHNDYLQIASDAGIPGILIAAFFLFALYRSARKGLKVLNPLRKGIATGALAGIFALLVHSLFDFTLHVTAVAVMFVLLLTLLVNAGYEYPDDIEEGPGDAHGKRRHRSKAAVQPIRR
jgi:O-antigen ligase